MLFLNFSISDRELCGGECVGGRRGGGEISYFRLPEQTGDDEAQKFRKLQKHKSTTEKERGEIRTNRKRERKG